VLHAAVMLYVYVYLVSDYIAKGVIDNIYILHPTSDILLTD
jgi:hypothetical protein